MPPLRTNPRVALEPEGRVERARVRVMSLSTTRNNVSGAGVRARRE